jgi:hypothetical protein
VAAGGQRSASAMGSGVCVNCGSLPLLVSSLRACGGLDWNRDGMDRVDKGKVGIKREIISLELFFVRIHSPWA